MPAVDWRVDVQGPATPQRIDALGERQSWWREWELWLLLLFTAAFYSIRVADLSVRGEESRRGRIAWEMLNTGDWIVPRIQGKPVFFRPPLQNWLIALVALGHGQVDEWALRLPSIVAMLLTVVLTYAAARTFVSRFGAFFSALCLVSLGQVLELGRLGETDSLFMLFAGGSLLVWKAGWNSGMAPWRTWSASYALAALATLAKGPQAPLYFIGSVTLFCLLTGERRRLVSRAHAAGLLTGLIIVGLWQVPYTIKMGFVASFKIYFHDVAPRFFDMTVASVLGHMLAYPLQLLGGSLLPWSLWLACLASPQFREHLRRWRSDVLYLLVCLAVTFPSVWLAPGASLRYYMALFPCLACLIGIVIEAFVTLPQPNRCSAFVCWYQRGLALLIATVGVAVLGVSWWQPQSDLAQTHRFAAIVCTGCVAAGLGIAWLSTIGSPRALLASFAIVACFLGLGQSTLLVNIRQRSSEDARQAVAAVRAQIPAGTPLVSLGQAHHLFLFHLGRPVRQLDRDADPADWGDSDYFCMWIKGTDPPQFDFSWERLATISCDRNRSTQPIEVMIVGRRKRDVVANRQTSHTSNF